MIKNENLIKNPFKFVKRIPKIKFLKKKTENVDNFIKNCQKAVFENRKKIYTRIYGDYLLHDSYGLDSKFFKAQADQIRLEFNDDLQIGYGFYLT